MPSPGLALIGFMSKERSRQFFREACLPADAGDFLLDADWQAATNKIGPAAAKAGRPDVQPLPQEQQGYVAELRRAWPQVTPEAHFGLVEIAPLITFQFSVDTDLSAKRAEQLSSPPAIDELMQLCLPQSSPPENLKLQRLENSVLIKSPNQNVRIQGSGIIGPGQFGIVVGVSLPLVQVVEFEGRWFVFNGVHRLHAAMQAGATHAPAMIKAAKSWAEVGIKKDGSSFDETVIGSANPPTMAHFTPAQAQSVSLRRTTRIITVNWSEYGMADEG